VTLPVFLAVLAAALLHAGWNVLVKVGLDRFSSVLAIALMAGAVGIILIPFFPLPARAAWPWVLAGSLLHTGYKLFLIRAYRHGELGRVYPLARGTAPLIVALAGLIALGERPEAAGLAAMLAIAAGILLIAGGERGAARMETKALAYALGTACFTAAYTLADGVGARLAGGAASFILWLFLFDGLFMLAFALATRGTSAIRSLIPAWRAGIAAGAMSLASYWIVVWAFTQAPLALVAALRETSVLFAMLLARLVLKEPIGARGWAAAALIVAGIALMRV
jgi:drug/metabolite transporter (DMT)-like permease